MSLTKRERLDEFLRRLRGTGPFRTGQEIRAAVHSILTAVEDEFSGIPENPDAAYAAPDGRMYPPHDRFEKLSPSPRVRLFIQAGHRTLFGDNGALKIVRSDGVCEIEMQGFDGATIDSLLTEKSHEQDRTASRANSTDSSQREDGTQSPDEEGRGVGA